MIRSTCSKIAGLVVALFVVPGTISWAIYLPGSLTTFVRISRSTHSLVAWP